mmetsp:Transcript_32654/g.38306  ORF Transcript_32654/g.38306 Transcript_32654/m.38306 type:complete len:143 (-) Transcript_32654:18-446(-)
MDIDNETFIARIYSIYDHWNGLRYIGSTIKTPQQRLKQHEYTYEAYKHGKYHFVTSFKVLCSGDYDISILETVEVSSLGALRQIEGKYIQTMDCVNKRIEDRTIKQYNKLCECGCISSRKNMTRHRKSSKHIKLMALLDASN